MKTTYNFILNDLLLNSKDKKFINGFINELVKKGVVLEFEYLNEQSFIKEPYVELKKLLDKTLDTIYLKLECVKDQIFEGAASFREKECKLLAQIKRAGFNLYKTQYGEFILYHVDADKKGRKLKFVVYTNSAEFVDFIEDLR